MKNRFVQCNDTNNTFILYACLIINADHLMLLIKTFETTLKFGGFIKSEAPEGAHAQRMGVYKISSRPVVRFHAEISSN